MRERERMTVNVELQAVIHNDEETGTLWASVVQLPGCFATGHTRKELMEALSEAVVMYLEAAEDDVTFVSERVELADYRLEDNTLVPA